MKLDSYIQNLLQDNDMVIIPGFGAFISEYQPAEVDNESDEIKPPSTRLIFNPQIKNNDGLLVGYVAETTRSSHFDALQKIEKERDNILYLLDKGEKVELEKLGTLFYNENNQIEFISETDKRISLDSFGLEATSLKEPERADTNKEDELVEEETLEEVAPVATPVEVVNEKPEEKLGEEISEEQEEIQPENEKAIQEEKPAEGKEDEVVAATVITEAKSTEPEEKEKKRKGGWIWLLVLLIPLIAVSVFIFMKDKAPDKPVKEQAVTTSPETEAEPVATIDTIAKDSSLEETTDSIKIEAEPLQEVATAEESGPKFYLVGGSFKEEENAETYLQELKEKGYEAFHLGKYGNFYIIGLGTYNSEEEALSAKRIFLDKNPGSGIWVLEK